MTIETGIGFNAFNRPVFRCDTASPSSECPTWQIKFQKVENYGYMVKAITSFPYDEEGITAEQPGQPTVREDNLSSICVSWKEANVIASATEDAMRKTGWKQTLDTAWTRASLSTTAISANNNEPSVLRASIRFWRFLNFRIR